jgi:Amt family ammonium transporter
MIAATALVLMMSIPGLALFYAGMVRKKNVLATMAQTFAAVAPVPRFRSS